MLKKRFQLHHNYQACLIILVEVILRILNTQADNLKWKLEQLIKKRAKSSKSNLTREESLIISTSWRDTCIMLPDDKGNSTVEYSEKLARLIADSKVKKDVKTEETIIDPK